MTVIWINIYVLIMKKLKHGAKPFFNLILSDKKTCRWIASATPRKDELTLKDELPLKNREPGNVIVFARRSRSNPVTFDLPN
jgi:hypothetical protein